MVGQLLIKHIKSPKNPVAWGKCFYWSWTSCQKCSVHAWQLAILFTKTFPCANWFWNFMCPVSWSYQYIFCMIHRFCISWRASSFFSLSVIELRACIIFNYIVFFSHYLVLLICIYFTHCAGWCILYNISLLSINSWHCNGLVASWLSNLHLLKMKL